MTRQALLPAGTSPRQPQWPLRALVAVTGLCRRSFRLTAIQRPRSLRIGRRGGISHKDREVRPSRQVATSPSGKKHVLGDLSQDGTAESEQVSAQRLRSDAKRSWRPREEQAPNKTCLSAFDPTQARVDRNVASIDITQTLSAPRRRRPPREQGMGNRARPLAGISPSMRPKTVNGIRRRKP
jgi:hypothetical protein